LLRDAAYGMQMLTRLQELHALAAETIESLYPDDLGSRYAELAYHADHAGLSVKARQYYTLAGKASSELYQNSQAIDYFTRALALTDSDDLTAQFSLLLERVDLFNRLADRPSQFRDLQTLESLAAQLNDPRRQARVSMLLAHYHISVGAYGEVLRCAEQVRMLTQQARDVDILLDTFRVWPLALLRLGRLEEAMKTAMQGRGLALSHGDGVKEGYILNAMGLIAIDQSDPAAGQQYLEQALSLARITGDRRLEAMTLANIGTSAAYARQDFDAAREYFEACYRMMYERGERSAAAASLGNLGWVAGVQGDFRAARGYSERALLLARETGNTYLEINNLINLSAASGALGQAAKAISYGQRSLELSKGTGDRGSQAWALHYMGYGSLLAGELEQAEASFRQSVAIREELGQPGMNMEPLAGLIQTYLARGDLHAALEETEKVLAYLEQGGTLAGVEEPLRIHYACYLALERAQEARADTVLRMAIEIMDAQLAKLRDERSRHVFVENVPWRQVLWRAWQARAT
jgi:tetratricopeptide (TPR) repeat protein